MKAKTDLEKVLSEQYESLAEALKNNGAVKKYLEDAMESIRLALLDIEAESTAGGYAAEIDRYSEGGV